MGVTTFTLTASVYTPGVTTASICVACGTQFAPSGGAREDCPICEDYRQFVGLDGQRWTTLEELRAGHRNTVTAVGDGVFSIHTEPKFGIGQRCLLVRSAEGNVLWDCISLLDEETAGQVRALGGIRAIAISHPHYYSTMAEWSEVFGAPVYIHECDRAWVMRGGAGIRFWSGEQHRLSATMTLARCGGHFEGAQVMHDAARRALFVGDVIQVVPDRRWVSFMRSYPNYIPLPATAVRRIVKAVEPFEFDDIYGAVAAVRGAGGWEGSCAAVGGSLYRGTERSVIAEHAVEEFPAAGDFIVFLEGQLVARVFYFVMAFEEVGGHFKEEAFPVVKVR